MIKELRRRGNGMIHLKEKDLALLGIKSIELDTKGNVIHVIGTTPRIDKIYTWAILGIDYMGG